MFVAPRSCGLFNYIHYSSSHNFYPNSKTKKKNVKVIILSDQKQNVQMFPFIFCVSVIFKILHDFEHNFTNFTEQFQHQQKKYV